VASASLAAAVAAGQQLRRGAAAAGSRVAAARAAAAVLESLTPSAAAEIASQFPLSISGSWSGGSGTGSSSSSSSTVLGPSEPLPILGVHWLDADALAILCQQGFSSLLLILNAKTLRVLEQVELMDQPVDREWGLNGGLAAWGLDCSPSVVGVGPRVYLLGQQGGVFCGRLMPWSERLKTLQVGCGQGGQGGGGKGEGAGGFTMGPATEAD